MHPATDVAVVTQSRYYYFPTRVRGRNISILHLLSRHLFKYNTVVLWTNVQPCAAPPPPNVHSEKNQHTLFSELTALCKTIVIYSYILFVCSTVHIKNKIYVYSNVLLEIVCVEHWLFLDPWNTIGFTISYRNLYLLCIIALVSPLNCDIHFSNALRRRSCANTASSPIRRNGIIPRH